MKTALIASILFVLLSFQVASAACSIQNRKDTQVGSSKAIEGTCSNSGLPITCQIADDGGISCDGPEGSYNGYDLNALVFSACGCSSEQEQQQLEKKEL